MIKIKNTHDKHKLLIYINIKNKRKSININNIYLFFIFGNSKKYYFFVFL